MCTWPRSSQVRIWQSATYRQETTLNYGMERAWALAATKEVSQGPSLVHVSCKPVISNVITSSPSLRSPQSNKIAIGYDEGCVVVEFGNDDPVASMDNSGKVRRRV